MIQENPVSQARYGIFCLLAIANLFESFSLPCSGLANLSSWPVKGSTVFAERRQSLGLEHLGKMRAIPEPTLTREFIQWNIALCDQVANPVQSRIHEKLRRCCSDRIPEASQIISLAHEKPSGSILYAYVFREVLNQPGCRGPDSGLIRLRVGSQQRMHAELLLYKGYQTLSIVLFAVLLNQTDDLFDGIKGGS